MFRYLKEKWNVDWFQFVLIFTTFALGGSLCARVGSYLLGLILSEKGFVYWLLYIPVVTLFWPLCVLLVSVPLGQYRFFTAYIRKMGSRMTVGRTKNNQPDS